MPGRKTKASKTTRTAPARKAAAATPRTKRAAAGAAGTDTGSTHAILHEIVEILRHQQSLIERLVAGGPGPDAAASGPDATVGAIPRITLVPERAA